MVRVPNSLAAVALLAACATRDPSDATTPDAPTADLADAWDARDAVDARDAGDVVARDATVDARDVSDAPDAPPWGLDTRPVNRTCVAFARPVPGGGVALTQRNATVHFANTTTVAQRPGDDTTWYVTEQGGRLMRVANDLAATRAEVVLDLTSRVSVGPEAGLLGVAFHPRFRDNGQVFVSYTAPPRAGTAEALRSRISRFRSRDGGSTADPASEEVLLELSQPYTNHNGGHIAFGPDGMLYAGFGDGGSGGDPMRNAQNTAVLLGKMLRLDVDHTSTGRAYAIPADNPFAGGGGAPEVWAWGLRNPWGWSFDRVTGALWAGDVGQDAYEEVDVIRRGGNYGWNVAEGLHCFNAATCATAGLVAPVVEYPHDEGRSITGGFVYRGRAIPWLVGSFVFADYTSGRLWRVAYDASGRASRQVIHPAAGNITAFAEDQSGELYAVNQGGTMYRLGPGADMGTDVVPRSLRDTGCVDPTDPSRPAEGMIPYAPNAPFWSDGAEKQRYLALPEGGRITVRPDGGWELPVGAVLVKHFTVGGRRVETRLFVRHADGDWAGYSYRWNDAQTDAALLPSSDARDLGGGARWYFPSRSQCMECHGVAAGRTLGLETAQLDGAMYYPSTGRTANQLATFAHLGLFAAPLPDARPTPLADPFGAQPLDARARAYLHTNCAPCHRPGGIAPGGLDLRATTPFARTGTCDVAPSSGALGIASARVIAPGDPARSVLLARVRATGLARMPPISSDVVDDGGAALLDVWARGLRGCL